jgi:hypothetical protein
MGFSFSPVVIEYFAELHCGISDDDDDSERGYEMQGSSVAQ